MKQKIMNSTILTSETGRSMVEMLGVLAIVGVLSVAGIAGFKNAMDKNRANTIINEAQKRATLVVPQIQLMGSANPTLNEFSNNDLEYVKFDTTVYTKTNGLPEGQFGIRLENVSKEICQNILKNLGDNTVIRRISTESAPITALTSCSETNTFLMVYNNDMSTNHVAGEYTFDTCPENFYQCATTTSCVTSENDCPSICALDEDLSSGCVCPAGRDQSDNKCGECLPTETYTTWTQPKLTSTTGNGIMGSGDFAVQASSEQDGTRKAWRAFDGYNDNTETNCWHSRGTTNNRWLSWYTKNPIKVNSITNHNRGDGGAVGVLAVGDFEIQYSDDNSNWITVVSGINPSNVAYDSYPQAVNATSAHHYWRLNILTAYWADGTKSNDLAASIGELTIGADELQTTEHTLNEETLMCE